MSAPLKAPEQQKVVAPVPFDLASIRPDKTGRHSPNLYRWMRKQPDYIRDRASVYRGCLDIGNKHTGLYIGRLDEQGWFIGARMMTVLTKGARAERWAHRPKDVSALKFKEDKAFWERYARIGRCAIDPKHDRYFIGDETRWAVTGNTRKCLWCGRCTQKLRRWTEVIREKRERWEAVSP